jgi:hypothetical protein
MSSSSDGISSSEEAISSSEEDISPGSVSGGFSSGPHAARPQRSEQRSHIHAARGEFEHITKPFVRKNRPPESRVI